MSAPITIRKNVAIPSKPRKTRYPWLYDMGVGDSVLIPDATSACREYGASRSLSNRSPKQFTARTTNAGCEIWRIR